MDTRHRKIVTIVVILCLACVVGCPPRPNPEGLAPDFAATVTRGTPALDVTFINMSATGSKRPPAIVDAERSPALTSKNTKAHGGPKSPDRTSDRGTSPSNLLVASFSLNVQGTVEVGTEISATNVSRNFVSSEWEVARTDGAVRTVVDTQTSVNLEDVELSESGDYEITLTVTDIFGFSDVAVDEVQAENRTESQEPATYIWDFGDNSPEVTAPGPESVSHSYAQPGQYTVILTMERGEERESETKVDFIQVFSVPAVEFAADVPQGIAPQEIVFTDLSEAVAPDEIEEREWDFGDGTAPVTTTERTVAHTYPEAGVFDVSLRVRTQFGGEATAVQAGAITIFEPEDDTETGTGLAQFALNNYLPLAVGNRWIYRSTGDTSFFPFHFALTVTDSETRMISTGATSEFFAIEVSDSLDRNNSFFLGEFDETLYYFADEVAVDNLVNEGFLEPFFVFPIVQNDLEPRNGQLFDPEIGPAPVLYESGSIVNFLPRLLAEEEYASILAGDPVGESKESKSHSGGSFSLPHRQYMSDGKPRATAPWNPFEFLAAKGSSEVTLSSFGIGDQTSSIAMSLREQPEIDDPIVYIFSPDVGITYLLGSATTNVFPVATIGPGTESFAIESTFGLTAALLDGQYRGRDDHNDVVDLEIFEAETLPPDIVPTFLLPSFGTIPAYLAPDDIDVFYLITSVTEGDVEYEIVITPPDAPVTLELFEVNQELTTLTPRTLTPERTFTQTLPFSTFFIETRAATAGAIVDFEVALIAKDDHGNTLETATPVPVGAAPVLGYLEEPGEFDVFTFGAVAGTTYTIQTTRASFTDTDTFIFLLDGDAEELARDDDGGAGLFSRIEFTATSTGPLYVEVQGFENGVVGPYGLTAFVDDHGNSLETATPVTVNGGGTEGALEILGEFDVFSFEAVAGSSYLVETFLGQSDAIDTVMFILNSDGETLFFDDDSGDGAFSLIRFVPDVSGTYYVEIQGFGDEVTGSYLVDARQDDHGDSFDTATPILVNGDPLPGEIDSGPDYDRFQFIATSGVTYTIETLDVGTGTVDTQLFLLDGTSTGGDLTVLAENDDIDPPNNLLSRFEYTASASQTLYIQVQGFADEVGPYQLSIVSTP